MNDFDDDFEVDLLDVPELESDDDLSDFVEVSYNE